MMKSFWSLIKAEEDVAGLEASEGIASKIMVIL